MDKFSWTAYELRNCKKVLDVGSGTGFFLSLMALLGHECYALDMPEAEYGAREFLGDKLKEFRPCNVEVDEIPWPDETFDAVTCSQALEHFSHSHLPAVKEMRRVLKKGGILELDVPNAAGFRNRWRMLRGKHITYDYEEHYLYAKPILYKGMSFMPERHNREFTLKELEILFKAAGFQHPRCYFLKSRRYRTGFDKIRSLGTMLKDLVPGFRKSLIGFAVKE